MSEYRERKRIESGGALMDSNSSEDSGPSVDCDIGNTSKTKRGSLLERFSFIHKI